MSRVYFNVNKEEIIDEIKYKNSSIYFSKNISPVNKIKNIYCLIDPETFKRYTFGPYYKKNYIDRIGINKFRESVSTINNELRFNSYKEFIYVNGFLEVMREIENGKFELDFGDMGLPVTREDVCSYMKTQGYSNREAAQIADKMWQKEKPEFECKNPKIKNYLLYCKMVSWNII